MTETRRRTLMLAGSILLVAVVVSYVQLTSLDTASNAHTYSRSITRKTSSTEERHALSVSENLNYASIFNMNRFNLAARSNYMWAHLIDSEVINYYDARSNSLKENASIAFNYTGTVHSWDQISIALVPESKCANSDNTSLRISSSNGTILFQDNDWATKYAYYDGSWHQPVNANEINSNLSKAYVVEMYLDYDEIYGSIAGFFSRVIQTVIMDENYQPRLISIDSTDLIS